MTPSFELWQRRSASDLFVPLFGVGLIVVAVAFWGRPLAVAGWGSGGVLVLGLGTWTFWREHKHPLLRLNQFGVTVNPGSRPGRGVGRVITWQDIEAVVCWKAGNGNNSYWVGVSASAAFRRQAGLDKSRLNKAFNESIGMPVMGTVVRWTGPEEELHRLRETAARVSPQTPFLDPHQQ
ncbi:hypothetical protein [Yinghuangia soli]|uniref:Uncharacterized protein n=1 Tax=Yinghuangia soli TaxID=2908204 RepID=A0AA41Q8R3_9ACTN|nr:hypothetical protein [Yinghuangia soli]MCF2533317.1 hypothetical protein [Yinghuangia soli]